MSKTEEKLNKEVKEGIVPEDVAYAMRSHTNATLDELKEKAWEVFDEKDINNNGYLVGYNKAVNDFSKLIDEVRNE